MASDKLILSFPAKDNNIAFSFEQVKAAGGIIQFMPGYEGSLILSYGLRKIKVKDEEIRGKAPVIQIYKVNLSPPSVEEELNDCHIGPAPMASVQDTEPTPAIGEPSWKATGWGDSPSGLASESSTEPPLTRSQRKNRKVRLKRKLAKRAAKRTEASEECYPLSTTQTEGSAKSSPASSSFAPLQGLKEQKELSRREFLEHQRRVFQEWDDYIRKTAG